MIVIQQPTKPSRRADKPISVRRQLAAAWRWLARGDAEITIRLADNAELRRLNAQFRGKRCVTDVLSFPYPQADGRCDGDVVIGLGVAATQARRRRVAVEAEIVRLGVHGLAHLAGLDHHTRTGFMAMRQVEFETLIQIL